MDSISQIVLGAAVSEAAIGRKVGNRAPLWGAIAGTIPDLDFVGNYFLDAVDSLAFHRSFTHSITFALLIAPILGWVCRKLYRNQSATFRDWTWAMFLSLFTHPLLDCFTTWGTMLFWPFSDYRIAFKSIFVIDPLYTLPFMALLVFAVFKPRESPGRRKLSTLALAISTAYLGITLVNKSMANRAFEQGFEKQDIKALSYDTRPTVFNNILWTANAETDSGFYTGYYSFLDEGPPGTFHYFPKNHGLLAPYRNNEKLRKLLGITQGYYTIEPAENGFLVNDLRFGEIRDFETGSGVFVFSYRVDTTKFSADGRLIISRTENDFKGAGKLIGQLMERMLGK